MDGSMGKKHPSAVPFRVDALEPDRIQLSWSAGPVLRHEQTHVAAVCNRDVAVHFDSDRVEIVNGVFLIRHSLEKRGLVVFHQWLAAGGPAVAMDEMKILGQRAADKRDVAAHDGR